MSRSFYQLPTPGSGPKLDHEELVIGGQTVLRQTVEAASAVFRIQTSFTRPADTTAYAAGDAMSNSTSAPDALTFADVARFLGGGGEILGALLLDSANQATKPSCELWLFCGSAAPVPDNDNAVFTPTDAELANLVGVIVFDGVTAGWAYVGDATVGAGGNVVIPGRIGPSGAGAHRVGLPFVCNAASDDLFGLVVARNAYTPVSGEVFTFTLVGKRQ